MTAAPVVFVVAAGLISSACARHHDTLQIGLKRIALDLAYKDETKAKPIQPQQVFVDAPQPAPVAAFFSNSTPAAISSPAPFTTSAPSCPTAAPGAVPDEPVSVFITRPIALGTYRQHNKGTFEITSPSLKLKGAFPESTTIQAANVVITPTKDATGAPTGNTITYDVIQRGVGTQVTTTTYKVTATELDLVKIVTADKGKTTTFAPTPSPAIFQFKGEGGSWNTGGTDPATGTAIVIQGATTKRALVDVCGKVYEAYQVTSKETMAHFDQTDPTKDFVYKTDDNDPNVYWIATQLGGLFLQQHIHTTYSYGVNGSTLVLGFNYDSTVSSVKPVG